MKKLSEISGGETVEILELQVDEDLLNRLLDLAFVPGEKIRVVVNNKGNYVVVDSKRGRFGLPIEIAEKIVVSNSCGEKVAE